MRETAIELRFYDFDGNLVPLKAERERERTEGAETNLQQLCVRVAVSPASDGIRPR
ncbi:MAG: hypothetical protein J7647_06440 [Cyanobacteria bacterium SBLK]|nr:hypothetical protein [Cyanobacteria bacterium SBLK]